MTRIERELLDRVKEGDWNKAKKGGGGDDARPLHKLLMLKQEADKVHSQVCAAVPYDLWENPTNLSHKAN